MSWSHPFPSPIPLADGRRIATLREAGDLMVTLPARHMANGHWQHAMKLILKAVALDNPSPEMLEEAGAQFARAVRAEGLMVFRGRRG